MQCQDENENKNENTSTTKNGIPGQVFGNIGSNSKFALVILAEPEDNMHDKNREWFIYFITTPFINRGLTTTICLCLSMPLAFISNCSTMSAVTFGCCEVLPVVAIL
jgi:hypothetical protein